jgi:hypothetical protein
VETLAKAKVYVFVENVCEMTLLTNCAGGKTSRRSPRRASGLTSSVALTFLQHRRLKRTQL